jgi:hypothetical protein
MGASSASNKGRQPAAITRTIQGLSQTRYCGIGDPIIETDEQMLLAQQCIQNPRRIEIQQREQEILEYLT